MGAPWTIPHANQDVLSTATQDGSQVKDVPMFLLARYDGANIARWRTCSVFKPQNAVSTNAEVTVWTPASGKKFRLMKLEIMADTTGNYVFKDNTAGTTIFTAALTANVAVMIDLDNGILSSTANNVLTCTGPGASHVSGTICGTEE